MRMIDADAEIKKREKLCEEKNCEYLKYRYQAMCKGCPIYEEIEAFDLAEEVKAEPVRHGRWIEKPPYSDETVKGLEFQIVCSRCDEQNSSITFDENSVPIAKTFYRTKFCPNCGAYMREDGGADNG